MSGKQIITSAVGKYVAATYQHNQQQIPGHAWVQPALGDTGTKIFSQPEGSYAGGGGFLCVEFQPDQA